MESNWSSWNKLISAPQVNEPVMPTEIGFKQCDKVTLSASMNRLSFVFEGKMAIKVINPGECFSTKMTKIGWCFRLRRKGRV